LSPPGAVRTALPRAGRSSRPLGRYSKAHAEEPSQTSQKEKSPSVMLGL